MDNWEDNMLWENDASLMQLKPGYREKSNLAVFGYFQSIGWTPEQAFPKEAEKRAQYAAYLAANTAGS